MQRNFGQQFHFAGHGECFVGSETVRTDGYTNPFSVEQGRRRMRAFDKIIRARAEYPGDPARFEVALDPVNHLFIDKRIVNEQDVFIRGNRCDNPAGRRSVTGEIDPDA